jgi:hypothetical protein
LRRFVQPEEKTAAEAEEAQAGAMEGLLAQPGPGGRRVHRDTVPPHGLQGTGKSKRDGVSCRRSIEIVANPASSEAEWLLDRPPDFNPLLPQGSQAMQ